MIDLDEFVELFIAAEGGEVLDETVDRILTHQQISAGREYMLEHVDTQNQADRIAQEVIIRDSRVEDQWMLERMPLIQPKADLSLLGEKRWKVDFGGPMRIVREEYTVIGIKDDGEIFVDWEEKDQELEVPRDEWSYLRSAVIEANVYE